MTVPGLLEEWRDLAPSEQAQFQHTIAQLFKDGLVWREDEGDRPVYNFLLRREGLVKGYLALAGWELRHDERLKIFHLAHRAGAHRRKLSRDTTIWLLVLRLLYAENLETDAVFLTRYPSATVGQIIERYTSYFGSEAQRKRTKFEDAMRELRAGRLIRSAEGRAIRATDTDLVIELLPALEVVVPASSIAEVAGRLADFAPRGQRPPANGSGASPAGPRAMKEAETIVTDDGIEAMVRDSRAAAAHLDQENKTSSTLVETVVTDGRAAAALVGIVESSVTDRTESAYNTAVVRAERDAELRYRENDTVRRHEELDREIRRLEAEVGVIRGRQQKLAADLLARTGQIRTASRIVGDATFEAIADRIGLLEHGFDRAIVAAVAEAIPALERGHEAAIERRGEADRRIRDLRRQAEEVEAELAELRRGHVPNPPAVERMRSLLERELGDRPRLLCELLEIPDPRWQDAVEALLGRRRFSLVVPPAHFEAALAVLDQARLRDSLYDVALLDLEKAGQAHRPALPGSLATKVKASDALVQAYVDVVLGHVMACDDVRDLRRHARAVTADVVRYEEFSVRAADPRTFRPWRIGERAVASQIENGQRKLADLRERMALLADEYERARAECEALAVVRDLTAVRAVLAEELDDAPLRERIRELRQEQESLDLSGVQALKEAWDRLAGEARQLETQHAALLQARGRLEREVAAFASGVLAREREMAECAARRDEICQQFPDAVEAAEAEAAGLEASELARGCQLAQTKAAEYQTRLANTRVELGGLCSGFNVKYQFAGNAHDPAAPEYAERLRFLEESRLPEFEADIAKARAEADDELREHIVHRLREQIGSAREQLRRINDALARIPPFRDERYHFVSQPADDLVEFYRLIMETSVAPRGTLFAEGLSDADKAVFDRFYTALTRTPATDGERREQDRLTDYRSYLDYDIEVRHASGQKSRLSRILGQNSGGENQTPFYVTIAASFVQLFKIGERNRKPCIRLVVFDEAFSKMDQDRIAATLDLFNQFQLQVVTATPLERCEYLVPKMCTSLVLTNLGDTVLIEPYRNYKARIAREDGEVAADAEPERESGDAIPV